jgi:CheY-like chemotaxis protein
VRNPVRFVTDGSSVIAYLKGTGEYDDREKFPLPGVLLLDLIMPRLDGFQVMEWLKTQSQFADMLIVVLTGHGHLSNMREAYMLGARSFLTKPCRVEDVQNLLDGFSSYWDVDAGEVNELVS